MTFELDFERAVIDRRFRLGEQHQQRPRDDTTWPVWGPRDGLLSLEYKVEGKGRCQGSAQEPGPGDLRTVARELRLHPHGQGAGQAFYTSAPVLSTSGLPEL